MIPAEIRSASAAFPQYAASSFWSVPWSWEPAIVLPLALVFGIYAAGAIRRGSFVVLRWRHASFLAGWVSLFFGLTLPIHELGEQLFSAHMLQHEILILVSAPLIAASHPGATCLWAFAPRNRAGIGRWVHDAEQAPVVRLLCTPLSAWLMEAVALWVWHIPPCIRPR